MINQDDNSTAVIARAINMLKEMPHPYPVFADMLRFFACIDYTQDESAVIKMVGNYLIAHIKGGHAQNYPFGNLRGISERKKGD
ncbi:MAG: hypothetical protein GWN55_09850 [Phycisphaerae bacterium]|nr:hypothetical protein [Phycisphaerae bacterium]NIS51520.1 hypothetical protein [Phycisphaerae bacterium]NIV01607.1 hypothetical protein [Phycisphaerae bacterium]NIW97761.1 hypothetical protein [Phycisphaerae bacterium]NIX26437.1 hypothetical protein [Phycisphaerae bacterium]